MSRYVMVHWRLGHNMDRAVAAIHTIQDGQHCRNEAQGGRPNTMAPEGVQVEVNRSRFGRIRSCGGSGSARVALDRAAAGSGGNGVSRTTLLAKRRG